MIVITKKLENVVKISFSIRFLTSIKTIIRKKFQWIINRLHLFNRAELERMIEEKSDSLQLRNLVLDYIHNSKTSPVFVFFSKSFFWIIIFPFTSFYIRNIIKLVFISNWWFYLSFREGRIGSSITFIAVWIRNINFFRKLYRIQDYFQELPKPFQH